MFKILWGIGVVLFLGCGIHHNPKEESLPDEVRIPQKIAIDITNLSTTSTYQAKLLSGHDEITHDSFLEGDVENLRIYVAFLEHTIGELKFNNYLGNRIIHQVQSHCKEIPINQRCAISANTFSLKVDQALVKAYERYFHKPFDYQHNALGRKIFYDRIFFVRYDQSHLYQYDIQLDLTQVSQAFYQKNIFDFNDTSLIQNIKWSRQEDKVLSSIAHHFSNEIDYFWTIHYQSKEQSSRLVEWMHLFDKVKGVAWIPSSMVNADFIDHHDVNFTQSFRYNEIYQDEQINSYVAYADLTRTMGFRTSVRGQVAEDREAYKIKKQDLFENYGSQFIASRYCDSREGKCSFYDTTNWYYSEVDNDYRFDAIPTDRFDELNITGGNLKEGEYFLLAPDYNLSMLSTPLVMERAVGMFIVFKGLRRGALYDHRYAHQLDQLQLVYARYNEDLERPRDPLHSLVVPLRSFPKCIFLSLDCFHR